MKIYIGCDHRGVNLKKRLSDYLVSKGIDVIDIGIPNSENDDYPEFAFGVAKKVQNDKDSLGILICGSGVGMSIAANKVKGIRCVRALSVDDAFKGRNHNGCNVIALGADITTDFELVVKMVDTFMETAAPSEERHINRVKTICEYEDNN